MAEETHVSQQRAVERGRSDAGAVQDVADAVVDAVAHAAAEAREPVNGWLHFAGALLATAGLVVLLRAGAEHGSARHVAALGVFGVSAVLLFSASAMYHLAPSPRPPLLRQLDHTMIYLYIAGTYTPICLVVLEGTAMSVPLLAVVWALAAAGVGQKLLHFRAPRWLSTALYVAMGWLAVLAVPTLRRVAPGAMVAGLVAGGVLYTVGAVFYSLRRPRGWPGVFGYHELWHLFVLAASATHYWTIYTFAVPAP